MTKMQVTLQENYSRVELLARTILGPFYIGLPHMFLLIFIGFWSQIVTFISFWSILFTGRYPESFFEFNEKYLRWNWRLNARLNNLCDGYPAFGINASDDYTSFEIDYPENLSRGHTLLKVLFGLFYVLLPHGFVLFFRSLASLVLMFVAFWVVLFTGEYPKSIHHFNVGTMRWSMRVNLYILLMTDQYPPFSGRAIEQENDGRAPLDANLK
jgi:hypothetical protein